MSKIKLVISVGFLGSGKTTLLKRLISLYRDHKIAVIVNDFGEVNIDSKIIESELTNVMDVTGGSLFCSCKSDQFLDRIMELSKLDLDYIFVEGSGLANPNTIIKILDLITEKTDNKIHYMGTIGVVDVTSLHKVISTNMVKNQLIYSDVILVNKTDLVEDDKVVEVIDVVREYNTTAKIIPTTYSQVSKKEIDELRFNKETRSPSRGIDLNTQQITLTITDEPYTLLKIFIQKIGDTAHRTKGFIQHESDMYFIEYVNGMFHEVAVDNVGSKTLVFLSTAPEDLLEQVSKTYQQIFKTEPKIK